ncbi:hypothetical protein A8H39_11675 [Paraburkholderia fungorum]|nr:hypothetical protein A8H39_11675 [Paraburkholderia fungorum]
MAGLALLFAAFCVHANASDAAQLRFGVDPTYAPFESRAPSGQLVGFGIDLGNEICRRLNVKCVWVETAFDGIIPALQGRKFEAILSAMSITPQREARVAFSTSLFITGCTSMAIPAMHSARRSAVLSSRSCRLTATGARSHGGARARYGSARLQRCRRFTQLRQPGDRPYRQRLKGSDPNSFPVAPESWLYMLSIKK